MTDEVANRVVMIRVAGILTLTIAYLSTRRCFAGLDLVYRMLMVAAVTLAGTALVAVWRADCNRAKSGRALAVFVLLFGAYYGSVLWLWGTQWVMLLLAAYVLTILVGPMFIPRSGRSSP